MYPNITMRYPFLIT